MTSTRSTIPAPPPNGVSSTWPPLSGVCVARVQRAQLVPGRERVGDVALRRNQSNHSGKSVTTSSCTATPSPAPDAGAPRRRLARRPARRGTPRRRRCGARRRRRPAIASRTIGTSRSPDLEHLARGQREQRSTTPSARPSASRTAQPSRSSAQYSSAVQRRRSARGDEQVLAAQRLDARAVVERRRRAGSAARRCRRGARSPRVARRSGPRRRAAAARAAGASRGRSRRARAGARPGRRRASEAPATSVDDVDEHAAVVLAPPPPSRRCAARWRCGRRGR